MKTSKTKALKLLDNKVAQFRTLLEAATYENRYSDPYDATYFGSEAALRELFSDQEAMRFREQVYVTGFINTTCGYKANVLARGGFVHGDVPDPDYELKDYRSHLQRCIAQLEVYRERIDTFWETLSISTSDQERESLPFGRENLKWNNVLTLENSRMTHKKKLQVFVSSTYSDLREERQAAVEAILTAGHIPAGMELFAAGDESQMNVIKRWIDESDVYMLILGGRYGSIEPKTQKSYIHLEYEYAVEKGKPLFSVVIDENYLEKKVKRYGSSVIEKEHPDKLKLFRGLVCSKMVRFWSDPKDIKLSIMETMADFSSRTELKGWIPGSEAKNILVREAKTDITYLIDHRGLWRPIKDVDTVNYLKQMFGYQKDESIEIESVPLQPLGDEVISIRDWKRPRTKAENLSLDAQFSTQVLKKYIRTKNGSKILSFIIRNNSEHDLQVNLAELVFDIDAPLVARDISPQNNPKNVGLLTCRLLFNDESESKKIPSQGEAQLDLFLQRKFTTSETSTITSVRLGYIRVNGVFCETEIMFHLYI